jgi:hypothetical protein
MHEKDAQARPSSLEQQDAGAELGHLVSSLEDKRELNRSFKGGSSGPAYKAASQNRKPYPLEEIAMTKNAPADPNATLTLQTVTEAPHVADELYLNRKATIFDDLSLIGALLFGEPIPETLTDEVEPDRRH